MGVTVPLLHGSVNPQVAQVRRSFCLRVSYDPEGLKTLQPTVLTSLPAHTTVLQGPACQELWKVYGFTGFRSHG